jgi:hypothetical protein
MKLTRILRSRPCCFRLDIGPRDPFTGVAFTIVDSALDLFSSVMELSSCFRDALKSPEHKKENLFLSLKELGKSSAIILQTPIHVGVALTQGLRNAPKIWGDENIRALPVVDGAFVGFKAGYKVY